MEAVQRLRDLHADLLSFTESRLAAIDRLLQELKDSINDFKRLLEPAPISQSDQTAYAEGKIKLDDQEYGINENFRHLSRALSFALGIDEIEAAHILVESNNGLLSPEDAFVTQAVHAFHDRRELVLLTFRLLLEESQNLDLEKGLRTYLRDIVQDVLDVKSGPPSNGSLYTNKCLHSMEAVEKSLDRVNEHIQVKLLLNQIGGIELHATLEFQRDSLIKQHEALGCILALLFRDNYTISEDLRKLNDNIKRWQRLDPRLIHYLPAISAGCRQYGSTEGSTARQDEADSLNSAMLLSRDGGTDSALRSFRALIRLWWTVHYSGWYRDQLQQDSRGSQRAEVVRTAMKDNALELLLSACSTMTSDPWKHPARDEMVALLLSETGGLSLDLDHSSFFFRKTLMQSVEDLAEAWITNMPDSIRRLKVDEDDERLRQMTAMQGGLDTNAPAHHGGPLHLECLLILISFAFEQRPEAAEQFWEDPEGNLYGFLQWASRRQTVPRVSAFCEMLTSISEGSECAAFAHKFLMDDTVSSASRARRMPSMNYQQIFAELELYSRKVHERPASSQVSSIRKVLPTDMNEFESPIMLSCYLRLLAHLCRETQITRHYVLENQDLDLPSALLQLSSGPVPSHLRASIFSTLEALLSDKTIHVGMTMWKSLDQWASNSHDPQHSTLAKTGQGPSPSLSALQGTLKSISTAFDQADAFALLLRSLALLLPSTTTEDQLLSFPPDLGSDYRSPGIDPYVDYICGTLFTNRLREFADESQTLLCSFHCLEFLVVCLGSFNENYVSVLDKSATTLEGQSKAKMVIGYSLRHPFGRIMQWLLTPEMNAALLRTLTSSTASVTSVPSSSPLVANLERCIDLINLALDLQATFSDLVRPQLRNVSSSAGVPYSSIPSLEDSVGAHPEVVASLLQYIATDHPQLSIRSLALLQKLSSSPKLNNHFLADSAGLEKTRRVVDMIGWNGARRLLPIADALSDRLQLDMRELEAGIEAPGYLAKDSILAFLNTNIGSQPDLPNIAHLLLGYGRIGERLTVSESLDAGTAVFDTVADLVLNYPDGENSSIVSWLVHIKALGAELLQRLWSSRLSKTLTMAELRRLHFLQTIFARLAPISQGSLWDGHNLQSDDFWYSTSAEAFTEHLILRSCFYDYTAQELRTLAQEKLVVQQKQSLSIIQGKTVLADGSVTTHMAIVDMLDFVDLDMATDLRLPTLQHFGQLDVDSYMAEPEEDKPSMYRVGEIRELLQLYHSQILEQNKQAQGAKPLDQAHFEQEADFVIARLEARNRWTLARKARARALHSFVDMVTAAVECTPMDSTSKTQLILHLLQVMLPKLDAFILEEADETVELAKAADTLLFELSRVSATETERVNDLITERLFQLFRACIEGISISNTSPELRMILYSICSQYLTRITTATSSTEVPIAARKKAMDSIRSASSRMITTLTDDAEDAGTDDCRLAALSLVSLLTSLARIEKSSMITTTLANANVLEILVEPLKHIAEDFQSAEPSRRPFLITLHEARLLLLLQISRTPLGASSLLTSSILPTIKSSGLFSADPDLGLDLDNTSASSALHNYYVLLAATLRLILSIFLNKGPQNEQVQYLFRGFLAEYRSNMVGVFKRAAGVSGKVERRDRELVDDCVRCYAGLAVGCGFLEGEDEAGVGGNPGVGGFT